MSVPPEAPRDRYVTATEHVWIPMPDGRRLAARMWLPAVADHTPVPALFEYIPYRKADMVRARDARNHPYFAAHGYACLRVDMRGSGDSEGVMPDMYSDDELTDARAVIDWIAAQAWCTGSVGMFGTSWGGTAALQANLDAPDALKAIIAVCATHDRYEDDIHHMGGCLLTDTLEWGATLPAILAAPPTRDMGPNWRAHWQDRLMALTFPVETWIREEARGAYWRRGSVIHDASRLSRPVLAIGGWSDRYSNSVMSLVSARPDLVWGVVGPWGHHYPDQGHPGPAIGFQELALDWWNQWLKPSGCPWTWPRLRAWIRQHETPADVIETRDGEWIETGPPEACTDTSVWHLGEAGLAEGPGKDEEEGSVWSVPHDLCIGRAAGDTGYFGRFGGLPLDQDVDDEMCLTFDAGPLTTGYTLYGEAILELTLAAGWDRGHVVARLNDVGLNGAVGLVTRGVRNLALDDTLDPLATAPDPDHRHVRLVFPSAAYRFEPGHRMRIALSASYWPMLWPSRVQTEPRIIAGRLSLPILRRQDTRRAATLPLPKDLPQLKTFAARPAPLRRWSEKDADGTRRDGWYQPYSEVRHHDIGVSCGYETRAEFFISRGDPHSVQAAHDHQAVYHRPDGTATLVSKLQMTSTPDTYVLEGSLTVDWQHERLAEKLWRSTIPRQLD